MSVFTIGTMSIVIAILSVACSSSYRMGDVIKADPKTKSADATASAGARSPGPASSGASNSKKDIEFEKWNEKWRLIQSGSDSVGWVDHFRVCAIKFRYRNYDELFRCLDLFEAKVARGGKDIAHPEVVRQVTPVLTGWMRASVYAELGEPDIALESAESAWNALPDDYRNTRQAFFGGQARGNFTWVAEELGGSSVLGEEARLGRDNPAGLDVSAETISMSLAAQRSLLYQHLGRPEDAKVALAELL